jgi:hypothetical protein
MGIAAPAAPLITKKNTKKQKFNRNSHFEQWGQIDYKLEKLSALTQEPAPKKNCPRIVKPSSASDFKWGSDGQYFFSFYSNSDY